MIDPNIASPVMVLREAFGLKEGQTLQEFVAETKLIKEDTIFVNEVRTFLLAQ